MLQIHVTGTEVIPASHSLWCAGDPLGWEFAHPYLFFWADVVKNTAGYVAVCFVVFVVCLAAITLQNAAIEARKAEADAPEGIPGPPGPMGPMGPAGPSM